MARKLQLSTKRLQIDKANSTMIIVIAIAVFVAIFSLVASKALWSQRAYQARVITKKVQARDILKANVDSVSKLDTAYQSFVGTPDNLLGGDPNGTGPKDGDNAKLVLDALPSKYDFPALATSLEKLLTDNHFIINSITGTDDQLHQQGNQVSPNPQPVPMPFDFTVTANYADTQNLFKVFEQSIRPFQIQKVDLTAQDNGQVQTHVTAQTYYQPGKSLKIQTEVVK